MRQLWFKTLLGGLTVAALGGAAFLAPKQAEAYQGESTPTGIFVTVTYSDPINVRGGPSTVYYPIVGQLNPGDIVPALGLSPGRDWIEISFSGGTGWVYASFVSISGGELLVVEPPPTPALPTPTTDLTLAAEFSVQPTATRLPTFTPPPPLATIAVTPDIASAGSVAPGIFIAGLGLIGGMGLLIAYILRK